MNSFDLDFIRFLPTPCGAMKRFITITAIVTATLGLFSCEKHSWDEETKKLYEHGDHKGETHDKDGDH